jgi:nucleoside-diphosphate-sugar epimerase
MITVLGASGFIGSHLVQRLAQLQRDFIAPAREEDLTVRNLGDVIYCIGLTADFRAKPLETVDAHVCKLLEVLQNCSFDSLLYLSSARVYRNNSEPAHEEDSLQFAPLDLSDLYNLSKAMGESLALASGKKVRIVRLSNVYGHDLNSENFLSAIIKEALLNRKVVLQTAADSEKDYVSIDDVVEALINIASSGKHRIYNLASGTNVSNRQLMERIGELTGCETEFAPQAPRIGFPLINIERLRAEFDFQPADLLADMGPLVESYKMSTEV